MFLKPSRMSSTEALSRNESQEFSFSEAATKGMQPLRETVSEFEMLTRAGKDNFCCYLCSSLPLHLCTFPAPLILAFLGLCTVTLNVPRLSPTLSPVVNRVPANHRPTATSFPLVGGAGSWAGASGGQGLLKPSGLASCFCSDRCQIAQMNANLPLLSVLHLLSSGDPRGSN